MTQTQAVVKSKTLQYEFVTMCIAFMLTVLLGMGVFAVSAILGIGVLKELLGIIEHRWYAIMAGFLIISALTKGYIPFTVTLKIWQFRIQEIGAYQKELLANHHVVETGLRIAATGTNTIPQKLPPEKI